MKKQFIMVIALLALVSMMIVPVCAETLTGTLGSGALVSDDYQSYLFSGGTVTRSMDKQIVVVNIELTTGATALIHYDPADLTTYDVGAPSGKSTTFILNHGTQVVSTGTVGYQRLYNNNWPTPTEIPGFQYFEFNSWNITGLSGTETLDLVYDSPSVYNFSMGQSMGGYQPGIAFRDNNPSYAYVTNFVGYNPVRGNWTFNKQFAFTNAYTATKPAGLGITGTINKTGYVSKAIIYDGITNAALTGQGLVTINDFIFNVPAQSIKIGVLNSEGVQFNSSILFSAAVPTVTPTPTTTIPAGYVRNNLYVWDQNDAQITGADVDVLDVENASWTNTTADADGWIIIDTLPYHTVNVYAHYPTAGIYLPNEILGLETGYYGGHNWVLVLYPYVTTPSGLVTLYINTRNYDTKAVLTGVNLQIKNLVTGAITGESTGSTDSVSTVVTNATNYQITGSKSGYLSKTININSGEGPSKIVILELSKATVTVVPTSTIPSGGVTPVITQDPNDPSLHGGDTSLKAQEMMNWLAMNGMDLVQLCFLVTVLALLGVKLGK